MDPVIDSNISMHGWNLRAQNLMSEFSETARRMGLDPDNQWVGGYVDCQWQCLPAILSAYGVDVRGKRVLEFGSNVGASSVVMARLGALVDAVDTSADLVTLARTNAFLHGVDAVFHHTQKASLPFASSTFDFILCNSVLEYVDADHLTAVIVEMNRVLAPGGHVLITGTSNRLWPREVHSRRWLMHWLPIRIDRLFGRGARDRGVNPFSLLATFGQLYEVVDVKDKGRAWLAARAAISGRRVAPFRYRAIAAIANRFQIAPGCLTPNISILLTKRRREARESCS